MSPYQALQEIFARLKADYPEMERVEGETYPGETFRLLHGTYVTFYSHYSDLCLTVWIKPEGDTESTSHVMYQVELTRDDEGGRDISEYLSETNKLFTLRHVPTFVREDQRSELFELMTLVLQNKVELAFDRECRMVGCIPISSNGASGEMESIRALDP